jgi:hypothetical protein
VIVPLQAAALSCLAPTVEGTFDNAQKSADAYVVVNGELTVDMRKMPRANEITQQSPDMTLIPANIEGHSLSKAGFQTPFKKAITLEVACFGPWCGGMQSGADVLAFLRRDNNGAYALGVNPCGGDVFVTPPPEMLKQVERCFKRGRC